MSDVAVLGTSWPLHFGFVEESEREAIESRWDFDTDLELSNYGVSPRGTSDETLYETPEFLYYRMIVGSNSSPFTVQFARRSVVELDSPTLSGIQSETIRAYEERLGFLERVGLTEGVELNVDSETDFWEFIDTSQFTRKAELVFIGEGNIRAIWEDEDENFLGLHFLGNRQIIYVIFRQDPGGSGLTTETGVESFKGAKEKVVESGLTHLVIA